MMIDGSEVDDEPSETSSASWTAGATGARVVIV